MNRLYLIVGPSGTGKTTLAHRLADSGLKELVSTTTRAPRNGEITGKDYYFVSHDTFNALVTSGEMLEHVEYDGNRYGIERSEAANKLREGTAIIVVEASGAKMIKRELGERVRVIALAPADKDTLRWRLLERGDDAQRVAARMETADQEARESQAIADYVVPPLDMDSVTALATRYIENKPLRYVYVAGPLSGDMEANTHKAIAAGDLLFTAGLKPYIPHLSLYWHQRHPHLYEEWMALDLEWLSRCDALLRVPGVSPGADREVERARAIGIPVFRDAQQLIQSRAWVEWKPEVDEAALQAMRDAVAL